MPQAKIGVIGGTGLMVGSPKSKQFANFYHTFAKPIETFFELSIGSALPSFGEQSYEPK